MERRWKPGVRGNVMEQPGHSSDVVQPLQATPPRSFTPLGIRHSTASSDLPWVVPMEFPRVLGKSIHVWSVLLDDFADQISAHEWMLSKEEIRRAGQFYFTRDRVRWMAGRILLKYMLGRYTGVSGGSIELAYSRSGKPRLASTAGLKFNLTHSEQYALLAIAEDSELGIDLEKIRTVPEAMQIAERFFTPRESGKLFSLREEDRQNAFFEIWTRKEAFLKASGDGISELLNQVEVGFADEPCGILSIQGNKKLAEEWSVEEIFMHPEYASALAYRRPVKQIACFHFDQTLLR